MQLFNICRPISIMQPKFYLKVSYAYTNDIMSDWSRWFWEGSNNFHNSLVNKYLLHLLAFSRMLVYPPENWLHQTYTKMSLMKSLTYIRSILQCTLTALCPLACKDWIIACTSHMVGESSLIKIFTDSLLDLNRNRDLGWWWETHHSKGQYCIENRNYIQSYWLVVKNIPLIYWKITVFFY